MSVPDIAERDRLLEILSWARPHDSEAERAFCRAFLDPIPGMAADSFGNRKLVIGDRPSILWSCHVDTVATRGGRQQVIVDGCGTARLRDGRPGMSLGADDGAGLWIMLNMIAAGRPGAYLFHRGEEKGCLGSRWIRRSASESLRGIDAAIALDRAGVADVITHQSYGRTCSDAFASTLAGALNRLDKGLRYRPDDSGLFTDTNEYADLIPECTNLSVGYHGQHGPRETLDIDHCARLLSGLLRLDTTELVIARDPARWDSDRWDWPHSGSTDVDAFADAVARHPRLAARVLEKCGIDLDDFEMLAWSELEDERSYRPLMTS